MILVKAEKIRDQGKAKCRKPVPERVRKGERYQVPASQNQTQIWGREKQAMLKLVTMRKEKKKKERRRKRRYVFPLIKHKDTLAARQINLQYQVKPKVEATWALKPGHRGADRQHEISS